MESQFELLSLNGQFTVSDTPSYRNYQCLFLFLVVNLLVAGTVLRSLYIESRVKNKQQLRSRHLAFYLLYSSEGVVQHSGEIGITKTNLLIVGLVGETVFMSPYLQKRKSSSSPLEISFSELVLQSSYFIPCPMDLGPLGYISLFRPTLFWNILDSESFSLRALDLRLLIVLSYI